MDISTWILFALLLLIGVAELLTSRKGGSPDEQTTWLAVLYAFIVCALWAAFQLMCWIWDILFG